MADMWTKQAKLPLSNRVADEVRRAILESRLSPGHRLVEGDLARDMQVSRATVREALRQLEREGLVSVVPWQATTVIGLSEREVLEVASLRGSLESLAVELAIPRLSTAHRAELEARLDRMDAEATRGDLAAINETDYEFHRGIWELADHRRLLQALDSLSVTIRALISLSNLVFPTLEGIPLDHRKIFRAMSQRRADLAKSLIHAHAIRFGESVLQQLRRRDATASGSEARS